MTTTGFSLSVSNAALSGLLYDCCNNESDQIGFLIGKTSKTIETIITDTQEPSSEKLFISDILSTLPLSSFSFYNAAGIIDFEQLEDLIGNLQDEIVGWYICRRNSVNSLCLRESLIDRQLRKYFESDDKYFIVGVISEFKDENDSTIEIQYTFYKRDKNNFIPVEIEVDNLAKTGVNFKKSSAVIGRFDLFSQLNLDDAYKVGMPRFIEYAQQKVATLFQHLSSELCDSEKEVMELKNRLKQLQPESHTDCQFPSRKSSTASLHHNRSHQDNMANNEPEEDSTVEKYESQEY